MAGSARTRFAKAQRLLSRADFDRVQNGADTRRGSTTHFLVLLTAADERARLPRLGIIASRRVGCAVRRNRAKRLVREWFRAADTREQETRGSFDMVVVVKSGAESLSAAEAAAELDTALHRAKAASSPAGAADRERKGARRRPPPAKSKKGRA